MFCSLPLAQAAPGGVSSNLRIWLDADQEVTGTTAITQWNDQSGNDKHVTQNTAVHQPSLNTASSAMNFHRSIEMDGDQDFLEGSGIMPNDTDDMTFFVVSEADQSSGTYNQLLGMGSFLAYPHVGFYSSAQVFYSSGIILPDYRNFSTDEPMRYSEALIYAGAIDYSFLSSPAYNYLNGFQNSNTPSIFGEFSHGGSGRFSVGGDDSNEDLDGRIAEVVLYNTLLTTTERHQVESYLAVKYGQTLTNNYLNSSAATVYTLDGSYNFGIFGLAKDLTGDLDQRISRSVNDTSGLVVSTDTDFTLANATHTDALSDGDYLLIGHDNGSVTNTQTADLSSTFDKRTIREWKVQNTASVAAINMQFGTLPALSTGQSYALIGDNEGNFSSGSTVLRYSNNTTFSDISFPSGTSYFTIAIITNKVEFTQISNNDSEDNGASLPAIAVFGYIPTTTAVTLNLSGTASNTTDYATPTLSIPAGTYDGQPASNLSLSSFSILDDTSAENDETIIVTLDIGAITDFLIGDANNDATAQNAFTYTIVDEDISIGSSGSLLTATDNSATANGSDTGSLILQLKETDGDNISLSGVDVTFTVSSGTASFSNNLSTYTTTSDVSGIASAALKSLVAGAVNITATIDRDKDGGTTPEESVSNGAPATVSFLPGPAAAANTTLTASPASVTADGSSSSTITVQAKDAQGNNLSSSGGIVTLAEDSASAILSAVTNHNDGTYSATISNTVAESVTISGMIDGNNITSGDQNVSFLAGNTASNTTTTITVSQASVTADGSAFSVITVQAKDDFNNNITSGGLVVTLANNGSATISPITDLGDGTYTATITNSLAENVQISGIIDGNSITSGNPSISFTPGAVSATQTIISVSPASVTADGSASSSITVQAKDAQGNNLNSSAGLVTLAEDSASATLSSVTDNNNGTYTATITNTVAEDVQISGTIDGNNITSGNPNISFTPGAVSADQTAISVSPASVTADGSSFSSITVQAKDAQGNNLNSSTGLVTLAEDSATATLSSVTDNNNGTYTATITNTLAEEVIISGTIDGNSITSGNPSISFVPGAVSAAQTTISVSPASVTADGSSFSSITVQAKDAQGNNLNSSAGLVTLAEDSASAILSALTNNNDGTYSATISNTLAEDVVISGTIDGNSITSGDQTISFIPGAVSASQTTISVSPASVTADGSSFSSITVQAKDAQGNNLGSSAGLVTLAEDSASATLSSVTDNNNGTYTATITNTVAEDVIISGTIDGNSITSGDQTISFTPGAVSASQTTISVSPASVAADGLSQSNITVQAKDAQGNNLSNSAGVVTLAENSASAVLSAVTDNNNGTYTATMTNTLAEDVVISGTIDGNSITSGNPSISFTPGAVSSAQTTISVSPAFATADGLSQSTITVQAKDAQGNNLNSSAGLVTLAEDSASAILSALTNNNDGTYSATITNTVAESVTISGMIDGNNITSGNPSISFTPGSVSAAQTIMSVSPSTVTAGGLSQSIITVQAKDALGNNLNSSGGIVTLVEDSASAILSAVTNHNDGTYSATISNTVAEDVVISGSIAGNNITSGNQSLTFIAGNTVSNTTTTITVSQTSVTADGSAFSLITVQAKDDFNNNITSGGLSIALTNNGNAVINLITDLGDGTYTATITNTLAENVQISGTIDGNNITSGNPSISFTPGTVSVSQTAISVSPASVTADGSTSSSITVQAKDAQGNNLSSSAGLVTMAEDSASATLSSVTDNNNGTYTATMTNTVAEDVVISGTIDGNSITSGNPSISFTPGAVSSAQTTISVSPASVTADGSASSTITVQAKDAQGNNLNSSAGLVTLAEDSASATLSSVTDNNNGTYTATITNTLAEDVIISGTIDGNSITSGNPSISFTPGAVSAAQATISVSSASVTADGSASSTITVQARDAQGNNLSSSAGLVTMAEDSASATLSSVTDNNNGTYTATITNTIAEEVVISGAIDGNSITSGNPSISFIPGIASAVNTSLSPSPAILRANGTDTSTIIIQAIDAYNNFLISGGDIVTLSTDNSAMITSVIDHNNGSYSATVKHTEVAATVIIGTINGMEISNTTTITFIPYGEAQIDDSDGQFIKGVAPLGATITVMDSNGFILCSTIADTSTGAYHCVINTALADGEILTVTTTDLAGNNETSSTTVVFVDSDNDGISDLIEASLTNNGGVQDTTINTDTDGDQLPDYAEIILGSDFLSLNSPVTNGHRDDDDDGVSNAVEYFLANLGGAFDSELATDTDSDGLPDVTELMTEQANFYDANKPTLNGSSDDNANSLTNAVEAYLRALSINNISALNDYDGDSYSDALEVRLASNPLKANEGDIDNDGVNNAIEAFLTGTNNDGGNTVLNDRDADGLPDIFELSVYTDLFDPASAINYAENGDIDNDGISDAIEFYLYGNTTEATTSMDRDSDAVPDIIEISVGSNAFKPSKPSIWVDIDYLENGEVEIRGNIAGFQAPPPLLSWNLSELFAKQPDLTDTYPTERSVRISGLALGTYSIQLTESRWLNGEELMSQIDYSFNIEAMQNIDTDNDGVSDDYDLFNGRKGKEEFLHTSQADGDRYYIETQDGQIARLGRIASLSHNEVANITNTQIEETVEFGQPMTLGTPSNPPLIEDTASIFDFEILNLPETASVSSITIPLHHPLPDDPVLLKFETNSSLWSYFKVTNQDNYSSAQGIAGSCPEPGDSQYSQGITAGHYCLQLQITDGGDNDADHQPNGAIRHLTGIGSGSNFQIGAISINNPDTEPVGGNNLEDNILATENIESTLSTTSSPSDNDVAQTGGGGGSSDHLILALLSLLTISLFSTATAAPTGGSIVHGNGAITTAPQQTTITQDSSRLAIDWQTFNVAIDEGVTFVQPNGSAIVLNRDFSGSPSQIFGNIEANGQVLLLNSAGIVMGESSSINVGSFLASDMETSIEDFAQGSFTLTDNHPNQGGITNLGNVQSKGSGGIYIAGQFIHNTGTLASSNGDIHLATADELIISTSESGLLGVQLTQALESEISPSGDLIFNSGDIISFNGNIYLDLFYSDAIKANTVNNQGLINAVAITEGNGKIFLSSSPSSELSDRITEVDNIVAGTETSDPVLSSNTAIEIELAPPVKVSIDTIMPDCNIDSDTDCSKYQAIKNYLSRLLLSGELPD